mgnify:CR=1 FL=1
MTMTKIFFGLIVLFLLGCTAQNEVPAAVKNLERFKTITVEHPNTKAPSFELTDNKGSKIGDEKLKGKVYVIQGFAPGCASCAREIANLNAIYGKFKDKGLEIISLDISSSDISGALDTKEQFNGGDWRWAVDTDDLAINLGMRTLESTYIVDKEGIIRYKDESISDADTLSKELEKLI